MSRWWLVDCEERSRLTPDTFAIAPRAERERLRVGQWAKLIFADADGSERMFVEVVEAHPTIPRRYVGVLRNEPGVVPLSYGDRVEFGPEHVAAIEPGVAPAPPHADGPKRSA